MNLGIPMVVYGLAASVLISHSEVVKTNSGDVVIYFLYKEDKGALF